MKRLLLILCLFSLAGFTGFKTVGGFNLSPPPTPVSIRFIPANPVISDAFVTGAQVATILVTMSDGSTFNGALDFSPPVSTACTQNGNSNNLFSLLLSPATITTQRNGAPSDDGVRSATIAATQNGGTACAVLAVTIQSTGVPAAAAVAGFNTQIINDDFQSAAFANPSTWLDCNDGSSPPATPLYWRAWVGFGTNVDGPCSAITQATDPIGGQLALKLHWQDSYYTGNNGHAHATIIQTSDASRTVQPRVTSRGFYLEVVARTDVIGGSPLPWAALWSYTIADCGYEIDGFEEVGFGNGVSAAIHNCNGSNWCINPSSGCASFPIDITQYHTYAWRQTAGPAGAGQDIIFCGYIDGSLKGCNSVGGNLPTTSAQLAGMPMTHQFGPEMPGGGSFLGNGSTGKNQWIKSVKIWSCSTDPNNLCNSSSNNP